MTSDQPKAKIFISYSRKDMAFADRLDAVLKTRGFEPLIDRSDISVFEDWWERIKGLIGEADTIIFVLSPDAVASPVCAKEIDYAASLNKRFAAIVCRQVEGGMVPAALGRLNFLFFDDLERFEANADQLVEICVLRGHQDAVWSAAFSPDGARIVTASDDKTARIWDVHFAMMSTLDLIDEACARRLRGMTRMSRDEMRLAGYSDSMPEIDVAEEIYATN